MTQSLYVTCLSASVCMCVCECMYGCVTRLYCDDDTTNTNVLERELIATTPLCRKGMNDALTGELETAVNCFIMLWVHKKVMKSLISFQESIDSRIRQTVTNPATAELIDVRKDLLCPFALSCAELYKLNVCESPMDMMVCLHNTSKFIVDDIQNSCASGVGNLSTQSTDSDRFVLTTDDILSITLLLMTRVDIQHPTAFLLFMKHFTFSRTLHTKYGFFVATYEACVNWFESQTQGTAPPTPSLDARSFQISSSFFQKKPRQPQPPLLAAPSAKPSQRHRNIPSDASAPGTTSTSVTGTVPLTIDLEPSPKQQQQKRSLSFLDKY
eukprot:c5838_g1_i1.p1 GENE.c5838_g1_i1~~c5838_g1_i1.p1  ORF type:complete len:326 (+),score=107.83 c5838_g1_i1:604-1581(+)